MKISVEDILDDGLSLDIEESFSLENHSVVSPIEAHLELQKTEREIIINGSLRTDIEFQCSRCLKSVRRNFDIPIYIVYHPIEEMHMERHELKVDEMDMGFYTGNELDLQDMLKEQILLNVQMKPLCDDNCMGICPECGTDLNTEKCYCEKKEVDPRLAVLKGLIEKRKE